MWCKVIKYESSSPFPPSFPSLLLQPFKFGLGFPHHRCPLCSVQSSCSPFFTPTFLKSNSTSSIHLNLGLPFFSPSSWFTFQQLLYLLSPPILTTCPSHSILRTLITVTISGDLNYYKFLDSLLFYRNHFHMLAPIFLS
jgi:hypothetical protein